MTMFRNKEKTATREQSYLNDYKGSTRGEQKSAAPFCRPMAFRMNCFFTAHMAFLSPLLTVQIMDISFSIHSSTQRNHFV